MLSFSLHVFADNAKFRLFLWIHCILPKAHSFYSSFSPTTNSFTRRCRRKRKALRRILAKNAQNNQKTWNYKDYIRWDSLRIFGNSTYSNYAMRFCWIRRMIENFEYLREFEKDFRKCWIYSIWYLLMIDWCKKSRLCVPLRAYY
jgi:hypothetical protein